MTIYFLILNNIRTIYYFMMLELFALLSLLSSKWFCRLYYFKQIW